MVVIGASLFFEVQFREAVGGLLVIVRLWVISVWVARDGFHVIVSICVLCICIART